MATNLAGRLRSLAPGFFAGLAVLLASLANFLDHNAYPFMRPEVGWIALGTLLIAAVMAPFHLGQRQWGRSLLEGFLTALFVDLNSPSLLLAVACGLAVALFTWWKRTSVLPPLAMIAGVVGITTILGVRGEPSWVNVASAEPAAPASARPAVLHLILDEHLGIEGFEALGPEGRRMADELRRSYASAGFALYGGAYSEHLKTVNSIPHIFNFGGKAAQASSKQGVTIGTTDYLSRMSKAGYRVKIFQNDYADLCTGNRVAECTTYDSSSLRPTLDVPMSAGQRAGIILAKFVQLSGIAAVGTGSWNLAASRIARLGVPLSQVSMKGAGRTSTVAALAALDRAIESLESARPGELHLMHILAPHYPYVVDRSCALLPHDQWNIRRLRGTPRQRQHAYFEQVRCTTGKVMRAVAAFKRANAGGDTVIIIHGDHGSRITGRDPVEDNIGQFSDDDMIAGFSTLFAVQASGIEPAYSWQPQPVGLLLRDLVDRDFQAPPALDPSRVRGVYLVDNREWKPRRRVPLPASWPSPN